MRGKIFVISGPSGAGKGSIISKVMAANPGLYFSVSATTRSPRPGEVDGREYFFVTRQRFDEMVERGEIENPYEFEHSNEPDWYKF